MRFWNRTPHDDASSSPGASNHVSIDDLRRGALAAFESGDPERGILLLDRAITRAREADATAALVELLSMKGHALFGAERIDEARPLLEEALALGPSAGPEVSVLSPLIGMAFFAGRDGRLDEARGFLEKALAEAVRTGDGENVQQVHIMLAKLLGESEPELAAVHGGLAMAFPTPEATGVAWLSLVEHLVADHRYQEARSLLDTVITEPALDPLERITAWTNHAALSHALGDVDGALHGCRRVVELLTEQGSAGSAVDMLSELARDIHASGRDARPVVDILVEVWESLGEGERASSGASIAKLADDLGMPEIAGAIARATLVLLETESHRDRAAELEVRQTLAVVLRHEQRFDEATEQYERALACAREVGDVAQELRVIGMLGLAYAFLGRLDDSLAAFETARSLASASGDERQQTLVRVNIAPTLMKLGRVDEAQHELIAAFEFYDRTDHTTGRARALDLLRESTGLAPLPPSASDRLRSMLDDV